MRKGAFMLPVLQADGQTENLRLFPQSLVRDLGTGPKTPYGTF